MFSYGLDCTIMETRNGYAIVVDGTTIGHVNVNAALPQYRFDAGSGYSGSAVFSSRTELITHLRKVVRRARERLRSL